MLASTPIYSGKVAEGLAQSLDFSGVPNRIRTGVAAVKGRCPRPLDDGDVVAGAMHLAVGPAKINGGVTPVGMARSRGDRPGEAQLVAVRVGQVKKALAP